MGKKVDWYGIVIAAIFALIFAILVDRAPEIFTALFRVAVADIEYVNFGLALAALLFAVWARFSPRSVIRAGSIEARRFELRDGRGGPRGVFGLGEDGTLSLQLGDHALTRRAALTLTTDGRPILGLYDRQGKPLVIAGESQDAWGLHVADPYGKVRVSLGVSHGQPALSLSDREGKTRTSLGFSQEELPGIEFVDKDGAKRAVLSLGSRGAPALVFANQSGDVQAVLDETGITVAH